MSYRVIIDGNHVGYTKSMEVVQPRAGMPDLNIRLFKENNPGYGPRPEWDAYFLSIADAVSTRGDCSRRRIGAVIVDRSRRLVSTGYNGVRAGDAGCIEKPCDRVARALGGSNALCPGYSDCRSVHAEANALLYADYAKCVKATLYISDAPCEACLKLIKAARIKRVVWPKGEMKL